MKAYYVKPFPTGKIVIDLFDLTGPMPLTGFDVEGATGWYWHWRADGSAPASAECSLAGNRITLQDFPDRPADPLTVTVIHPDASFESAVAIDAPVEAVLLSDAQYATLFELAADFRQRAAEAVGALDALCTRSRPAGTRDITHYLNEEILQASASLVDFRVLTEIIVP